MKTYETIKRQNYTVTAKNECVITSTKDGKEYTLLTLEAGQQGVFIAISDSVTYSDDEALILPFA